MTRRIDELGRLVIPKEIRKSLKIKNNDQVEINIADNKIILSKYENLNKDHVISLLINVLKKTLRKNVLFTSRNNIIDCALDKDINCVLTEELLDIIENRKDVVNYNYHDLLYTISPLIINGDLYGSVIICSKESVSNKDLDIINFSKTFLENYLE